MEIQIKHGVVVVPDDFIVLGTYEEYRASEGASVIEFRNGDIYNIPHAVIPTIQYSGATSLEIEKRVEDMIKKYPSIGELLTNSVSPSDILAARKAGNDIPDDGIWPVAFRLYKQDSAEYEYLVRAGLLSYESYIIPLT